MIGGFIILYEDYKKKRKLITNEAINTKIVKKGNRSIHTLRVCALCGRHLTEYMLTNQKYIVTVKHKHLQIVPGFETNLCFDSKTCYLYYNKRKGVGNS